MDIPTFQATITGAECGYVYVMSYPGSNKIKIGHSKDPISRAADIGGTLAPETPIVEAYFWCSERREAVERMAHKIEAADRYNGEWFSISVERAVQTIKQAGAAVAVQMKLVYDRNDWATKAKATPEAKRLAEHEAAKKAAEEAKRKADRDAARRLEAMLKTSPKPPYEQGVYRVENRQLDPPRGSRFEIGEISADLRAILAKKLR